MFYLDKFAISAYILTILNILCGIIGIILSLEFSETTKYIPFQLLMFAEIFDFLDGKLARRSSTPTSIGIYADSIGDTISFAILPGIMLLSYPIHMLSDSSIEFLMFLGAAVFYTICGWIRLVRFTFRPTSDIYEGFPSPAAALLVGALALLLSSDEITVFWELNIVIILFTVIAGFLMITTIKYPSPKRGTFWDNFLIGVAGVVIGLAAIFPNLLTMVCVVIITLLYMILGPFYFKETGKKVKDD